ncbi:MurR/RpiR family transcriptional regulator [Lapillicoccus sp.]|uniref:MurR/RpiR family transcriptional regulator n=1 Tax=Lapillicoccus sp. TaxID=1909287 RepID=UPI0025E406B2|nr:MurR/RpiR family transcriptional regulator [Lapillicoccus sp.]
MAIDDQIFARMGELSPAEKKVARALLSTYPSSGLQSAAALAKEAGTSTPTVLRLVARLGIGSYPDFQRRLREEITHHMSSPVSRTERGVREHEETGSFTAAVAGKIGLVGALASSIPPSEFDHAVGLLAARPKQVAVCGGYFSRYLAMLFATQLDQAIPHVIFVAEPLGHDIGRLLGLTSGTVAIIIDFRRYELTAKQAADIAKQRGATVIVITDQGLSPAAESADIVLPVPVDGIPFDSFIGLLALLETLVEAVLAASDGDGLARMKEWEQTVQIARAYRATALSELNPAAATHGPDLRGGA